MKLSFGSLLLLSGLVLGVPVAATAATVRSIDQSKRVESVQMTDQQKQAKVQEEHVTTAAKTKNENDVPDLSTVDWTQLARLVYGKCGEYHDLAISVGWPEAEWPMLSKIMFRESRCNPMSHNKTDPTSAGSRGLIQINGSWCLPNRWNPTGYLQALGILTDCDGLWDPATNLRAGVALYNYSLAKHGNGWVPWRT